MLARSSRRSGWSLVSALPWRGLTQRYSFVFFLLASLFLLILARVQPAALAGLRVHTVDNLAPVMDAAARPLTAIEKAGTSIRDYLSLRADNQRLLAENAHLNEWRNAVVTLEKENRELRGLLRYKAEPGLAYISARVIADTGGAYARGLIVTAGKVDGVREGMAAMTGDGLIGRVVEVGDWSSRIMLVTDLNSRIPVTVAETGDRAILAGDNSANPRLLFLPRDAAASEGAHVVTSGHGGVFPPNLPIGLLHAPDSSSPSVLPLADMGRVTYVRLVDFGLNGGAFNPVAAKAKVESKKK